MMSTTLRRLVKLPPVEWERETGKLSNEKRRELETECNEISQRLILLGSYGFHSCESTHEQAVKLAMSQLVKVRRALGYAYPKAGVFSF